MRDLPFTFKISIDKNIISSWDKHITRKLSDMQHMFLDTDAYNQALSKQDITLYDVYSQQTPEIEGELLHGVSVIYPGLIGQEYYMTKGHFHAVLETGEIYYCLSGEGVMVMETPEGDWAIKELRPNHVLYVPPRWAHRSVNTSLEENLMIFFTYPANAGHDYRTIEEQGFRKLVVYEEEQRKIIDNPRWLAPSKRSSRGWI